MHWLGILVSGRGSNMDTIIAACEEGRLLAEVKVVISNKADAPALDKACKKNI